MKRHGLDVQRATVLALFLREIKTRFGKFRLGYCWALLEPLLHLAILLFVLDFVMERTLPDISFPVFLLSGIIPYFILAILRVVLLMPSRRTRGFLITVR